MALHECPTHDSPSDGAAQRKSGLPEWAVRSLENSRRSHHIENRQPRLIYNEHLTNAGLDNADKVQRPHGHAQLKELASESLTHFTKTINCLAMKCSSQLVFGPVAHIVPPGPVAPYSACIDLIALPQRRCSGFQQIFSFCNFFGLFCRQRPGDHPGQVPSEQVRQHTFIV